MRTPSTALAAAFAAALVAAGAPASALADNSVVLFPSLGRPTLVTVRGQALKTSPENHQRSGLEKNVRRLASVTWGGAAIEVGFQGQARQVVSDKDGLFEASFPASQASPFPLGASTAKATAGTAAGEGQVQIVADEAPFLVVSDFDDTVAVTNVQNKGEMLKTALLGDESSTPPVEGMAAFYACLAQAAPAPGFAFVSGSPVEFGPRLQGFLTKHAFPFAALHLRVLGPKTMSGYKEPHLRALLSRFPQRFVLVGDSGEADPEVYATILKEFPGRVAAVYIHDVGRSTDASRFKGMVLFKTGADAARAAVAAGLAPRECVEKAFPSGK
ncbi:MAG TPA: phosphatase domain-containing protein [Myxococcales bacterium]